jgi:N-acyl-D-aspartate/D-glutamate deacylase
MRYDLVIRNGMVVDGTGMPAYRADVGVLDGRIATIGRVRDKADEEIDAEGHVVTPGFIDGHTHFDAQIFWDHLGTCSAWHGTTTAVMGHCGFTLAPARPKKRALVVRNLERAEDISPAAMAAGIDWTWTTFREYLDAVDQLPKGINYASNIGHSALRTYVMGERAFDEASSDADIAAMETELRDALHAGAIGFTTSRSDQHETSDNRSVASRLASWDEVCRLVSVMSDLGTGIFQVASEPAGQSPDPEIRREYFDRLRTLALSSGVPISFGVSPTAGGRAAIELIDDVCAQGGRMFGLSHSRGISVITSFKTRLAFDVLAEWKEFRALPLDEQKHLLRDDAVRARLVHAAHHGDYGRPIGAEARKPDYDRMRVFDHPLVPFNASVAEVAAKRGVDPVELIIDLALESNMEQFFVQPLTPGTADDLIPVMRHPRSVMTFSDSGAHVSQIADFSIQTHLLAYWVRERQEFSIEEAVRMLTLAPSAAWGFHDRGLLREGLRADINVFDTATIGPEMPTVEHDLPGGARRLVQKASGFKATIVNGQALVRDGAHTGAYPGQLLRGPLAASR